VIFALICDGVTISRVRATIAPPGFSTSLMPERQRALAIAGLKSAAVMIAETVKMDHGGDPIIVDRSDAIGSHFTLDAVWPDGTSWRTELYDRTARPRFTDISGSELPPGWHGCIDALFGVYATCPDQGKLTLELAPTSSNRCIARPVQGETPLYAFSEDLRALLATSSRLDTTARLEWVGVGARRIEVGLFDVAIEARDGEVWPSYADMTRLAESGATQVTLLAAPLADPADEHVLHDGPPNTYRMRRFAPPITAPGGPWLVYGRVDGRKRIRPRVIFTRPIPNRSRTRLLNLVLSSDNVGRRQNMLELLRSGEASEQDIEDARRLIVSFQPRTPLQSLDLAVALSVAPEAAVRLLSTCSEKELDMVLALEHEMNFLWCVTPVHSWHTEFERRKKRLLNLMVALPNEDAERYARGDTNSMLQAVVVRQPALAFHVFCVIGGRIEDWRIDLLREANDCVVRNGHAEDSVFWPSHLSLAIRLGTELPPWIQTKQPYCWDVLSAPLVAARVAAGLLPFDPALTEALRLARLFDPVYFDRALPTALLPLAIANTGHA
jgi:hypothetical protein